MTSDTDDAQTCSAELYVNPALSSATAIESSSNIQTPTIGHTPVRAALTMTVSLPEEGEVCGLLRDGQPHNIKIQVECEVVVVPVR